LPSTAALSVDDAVHLAVRNNPSLSASKLDIEAAQQGARSARALANPQVVYTPAITSGGSDTELLVQQPLEINGSRSARVGAAEAQVESARAQALSAENSVVFSTKTAYYELVRAQEQLALASDQLEVTQEFDGLTRQQVDAGTRPTIDQIQSGIEVTRAKQQVVQAQAQADVAQGVLNTLLGHAPQESIGTVSAALPNLPSLEDQSLLVQALRNRPEIMLQQSAIDASQQDRRAIRAEGIPDLAPQYKATKITNGVQDGGLGVGLTIPFIDYGSRHSRLRQNEEATRADEIRLAAIRDQVRQEVTAAIIQLRAAETVLQAYPQGLLDQSRQLLDASRVGYQDGKTSLLALLDAQRTYREVQSDYINAQVADAEARAELERSTAADPFPTIPGSTK